MVPGRACGADKPLYGQPLSLGDRSRSAPAARLSGK